MESTLDYNIIVFQISLYHKIIRISTLVWAIPIFYWPSTTKVYYWNVSYIDSMKLSGHGGQSTKNQPTVQQNIPIGHEGRRPNK